MTNPPNPITPIDSASDSHKSAAPVRPLLVNVTQAAQILCVSRSSIYQLIWTDQLVPIRIGRSVRFSIEQLERFIAERILHEHGPTLNESA